MSENPLNAMEMLQTVDLQDKVKGSLMSQMWLD